MNVFGDVTSNQSNSVEDAAVNQMINTALARKASRPDTDAIPKTIALFKNISGDLATCEIRPGDLVTNEIGNARYADREKTEERLTTAETRQMTPGPQGARWGNWTTGYTW